MPYRQDIKDGAQSLDDNLLLDARAGNAWESGLKATAGNGNLTVDLTSGSALVGGASVSVSAGSVTISSADPDQPRKDLIYVDGAGALQVAAGTPAPLRPTGSQRAETYSPAPPDATGISGTVLWEVWVAAGATSLATADLRDRRVSADVTAAALASQQADLGKLSANLDANSKTISNANLSSATLISALGANGQNVNNVGSLTADEINNRVQVRPSDDPNTRISELPSSGGVVEFEAGTHTISTPITDNGKTNLEMRGAGSSTVIKVANGADMNAFGFTSSSAVTVRDLEVDGNKANQGDLDNREDQCGLHFNEVSEVVVKDCHVHDTVFSGIRNQCGDAAVEHFRAEGNRIEDVKFQTGNVRDGITCSVNGTGSLKYVHINNNFLSDIGTWAIEVADNTQFATVRGNVVDSPTYGSGIQPHNQLAYCAVVGNVVHLDGPQADTGPAIRANNTPDQLVIANNVVQSSGAEGIDHPTASASELVSIIGNTVRGTPVDGIVNVHDDVIILGNSVLNAGDNGIQNSGNDCIIAANRVKGSTNTGINDTGTGTASSLNITGDPN